MLCSVNMHCIIFLGMLIMPANAKVVIQYGPYEACGIVVHRTARLEGMESMLMTFTLYYKMYTISSLICMMY